MAIEDVPSSLAGWMKPMPRATLKSGYAVQALAELALAGRGERLPVSEIARHQCIPPRFLERIFRELRRAELLCSRRGTHGGYSFAMPPEDNPPGQVPSRPSRISTTSSTVILRASKV